MNQMITPAIRCARGLLVVSAIALPSAAQSSRPQGARGLAAALDSLGTLLDAPGQKALTADSDVDVRFTIRAPTALKPQPFLRLSRIGGLRGS